MKSGSKTCGICRPLKPRRAQRMTLFVNRTERNQELMLTSIAAFSWANRPAQVGLINSGQIGR
jgi:hypothetical protein